MKAMRDTLSDWRNAGDSIALVPTMGNLHAGHLSLVREARSRADRVVVSLFVNPLQFGEGEDFVDYPRTLPQDQTLLREEGTDLLFAPTEDDLYPRGRDAQTQVSVPGLSDILCGAHRPGHFTGVATVVCKLFNLVQPDLAVFGRKDYQQFLVIQRMAADLNMPLAVLAVETWREADGLAMSSRNQYLTAEERNLAPQLFQQLSWVVEQIRTGERDFSRLEQEASESLHQQGFQPDYFSVRRADDLEAPDAKDKKLVILAAAVLGRARLIDNLSLSLEP
jgi:pantoate--beta-alanine ligase